MTPGHRRNYTTLTDATVGQPISGIEDLLTGDHKAAFGMPYSATMTEKLLKDQYGWTEAFLEVPRSALVAIVDHVRTTVLDWALELEQRGIAGDGRSFTQREREAASNASVSIQNFYGQMSTGNAEGANSRINLASMDQSQNTVDAEQIFQRVESAVRESSLDVDEQAAILAAVNAMRDGRSKGGFGGAYAKFAELAANHITVLGPFLAPLAGLIAG